MIEGNKAQKQIQLHFGTSLSAERRSTAISAFAALLKISPERVKLRPAYKKNVEVDLNLSAEASERLYKLLQTNSGSLRLLGIEKVILERASGEIQSWSINGGKFDIESRIPPLAAAAQPNAFEPVPRIWLFHLVYFVVTAALSLSILSYARWLSMSLLLITVLCGVGMLLAGFRRLLATHILAVGVGIGAPIVLFARLWPSQTIVLLGALVVGVFLARRFLF